MGFKAVTIEQNGQNVLIGWVPEAAVDVNGADLQSEVFPSQACPEPNVELRRFIDANANRSFNLHKYEGGSIVCRSIEELDASTFLSWDHNWSE